MEKNEVYSPGMPLREKILYLLRLLKKGEISELASEVAYREGISSEEGLAEITLLIEQELHILVDEGLITRIKEHRQKIRYTISVPGN